MRTTHLPNLGGCKKLNTLVLFLFLGFASFAQLNETENHDSSPFENRRDRGNRGTSGGDVFISLDEAFDNVVSESDVKGFSAAIMTGDGSIWKRAAGVSQENPTTEELTEDHILGIASNTKSYIAATMLLMAEDGLLDLDDPMNMYLDPIENTSGEVTIRQLLGMRSGFSDYFNDNIELVDNTYLADVDSIWEIEGLLETFLLEPEFQVDETFYYTNTNFLLAALIMESAGGNLWYEEVRNRVLDPLGLENTFIAPFEQPDNQELAHPFSIIDVELVDATTFLNQDGHFSLISSAGSIISTAEDLAIFRRALHGGELLEESSYAEMTLNNSDEEWRAYGLGIQQDYSFGESNWGHGGFYIYRSVSYYFPECDYSIVTIQNDIRLDDVGLHLFDMLLDLKSTYDLSVCDFLSVDNESNLELRLYPNPSEGVLNIQSDQSVTDLRIIDLVGNTVMEKLSSGENRLDDLSNGTYIVVGTSNGAPIKQKLVIAR